VSEFIIELKNIVKRFSGVEILHQVHFQLRHGEVHALLGEEMTEYRTHSESYSKW